VRPANDSSHIAHQGYLKLGSAMNPEDIQIMNSLKWYHSIELAPGVKTPGYNWDHLWNPIRDELTKIEFRGKAVLDVGSWDGMWAFEAEKRGAASVVASDHLPVRTLSINTGLDTFEFAKRQLNSKVAFAHTSIYDLDKLGTTFDIVMCFGVIYHLRYPAYALAQCRNALKLGGSFLMETAILLDDDSTKIELDYHKIYPLDQSTWCAYSKNAMELSLEASYFEPKSYSTLIRQDEELRIGRGYWRSEAIVGRNYYHYFPYPRLEQYFERQQ
jgi:tRNA (mo5U34)-methyltransferase